MNTKVVAFRLPEEIIEAIETEAKARGQTKTAIVVEALRQHFKRSAVPALPVNLEWPAAT